MESIIIALDNYEEIFDDFDISDYSSRAISSDFIYELKKRLFNRGFVPKIILTIPASERNKKVESIIIKRIKRFFKSRINYYMERKIKMRNRGLLYLFIGVLLLLLVSLMEFNFSEGNLVVSEIFSNFMLIPSWFFVWEGLYKLLEVSTKHDKTIGFYNKLIKSKIVFDLEEKYEN